MVILLQILLYALLVAVFVRVAFSWVGPPDMRNPLYRICFDVTEPLLGPLRRVLPPTGGLDLSPTVLMIVIFLVLGLLGRA